ncbi:hypothetical protein E2C01_101151 [Portunus trituberculatus]|uniref:Uncharacterized protein n=1 Tax=Portunus trituberculatus TaxID=210409 RepID=A0A5B7K8U4_PORTR|nr:hypothetical protein [Portunus trituberculatus]
MNRVTIMINIMTTIMMITIITITTTTIAAITREEGCAPSRWVAAQPLQL